MIIVRREAFQCPSIITDSIVALPSECGANPVYSRDAACAPDCRKAQQRFRERQRARLAESEERLRHLSGALAQLQASCRAVTAPARSRPTECFRAG